MLNFREELSRIKERKLQRRDGTYTERILKEVLLPYIEKEVSSKELSEGKEFTFYNCVGCLTIVSGKKVIFQERFENLENELADFYAIRDRLQKEGFEITEHSIYNFVVVIKA